MIMIRGILTVLVVATAAAGAAAQSASSATYFLAASQGAPGGTSASANYNLDLSVGAEPGQATSSASYRFVGGFNAAIDAATTGAPWITGVMPRYADLLGGSTHMIYGHELDLGAASNVTVGGVPAVSTGRTRHQIPMTLPLQSTPGWQPVTVTNGGGVGHLPRGVGVKPLVETGWPIQSGEPFRITYRGNVGDVVFLAVASARLPVTVPIPPYHYGLEVNPGALIAPLLPLAVADPSGVLNLDFPGVPLPRPIYVQMLALPVKPGSYQPGSFTNTISL